MRRKEKKRVLALPNKELDQEIKIQGTKWDRKRTIPEKTRKQMHKLYNKGFTYKEIAQKLNLNPIAVRYNVDILWKMGYNARRNGAHTGTTKRTYSDRCAYKRGLIESGHI